MVIKLYGENEVICYMIKAVLFQPFNLPVPIMTINREPVLDINDSLVVSPVKGWTKSG